MPTPHRASPLTLACVVVVYALLAPASSAQPTPKPTAPTTTTKAPPTSDPAWLTATTSTPITVEVTVLDFDGVPLENVAVENVRTDATGKAVLVDRFQRIDDMIDPRDGWNVSLRLDGAKKAGAAVPNLSSERVNLSPYTVHASSLLNGVASKAVTLQRGIQATATLRSSSSAGHSPQIDHPNPPTRYSELRLFFEAESSSWARNIGVQRGAPPECRANATLRPTGHFWLWHQFQGQPYARAVQQDAIDQQPLHLGDFEIVLLKSEKQVRVTVDPDFRAFSLDTDMVVARGITLIRVEDLRMWSWDRSGFGLQPAWLGSEEPTLVAPGKYVAMLGAWNGSPLQLAVLRAIRNGIDATQLLPTIDVLPDSPPLDLRMDAGQVFRAMRSLAEQAGPVQPVLPIDPAAP